MFISDPHEQQAPFWRIDSHFSDDLVKGLAEQFLPNRANPLGSGLPMLQGLIQCVLEPHHIRPLRFLMRDVLHEMLAIFCLPIPRKDHIVEDIYMSEVLPSGLGLGSNGF